MKTIPMTYCRYSQSEMKQFYMNVCLGQPGEFSFTNYTCDLQLKNVKTEMKLVHNAV